MMPHGWERVYVEVRRVLPRRPSMDPVRYGPAVEADEDEVEGSLPRVRGGERGDTGLPTGLCAEPGGDQPEAMGGRQVMQRRGQAGGVSGGGR